MGKNLENEEWREEAPTLSGVPVRDVFSVPKNYFEELSASIEAKKSVDNLRNMAAEEAFSVPTDYFEKMRADIFAKTKSPSKVLKIWRSNVLKYASAACFVLVAGLGVYFNQEQPSQSAYYAEIANEQMLFDIDEDVIIDHIQGTEAAITPVSADQSDLESYILTNFSTTELTAEY